MIPCLQNPPRVFGTVPGMGLARSLIAEVHWHPGSLVSATGVGSLGGGVRSAAP
jgi:hypothetical protein